MGKASTAVTVRAQPLHKPSLWHPQARFTHLVADNAAMDMVNESGGIAVTFEPLPKSQVRIEFEGSQSETFSVWTTNTRSGFTTAPKIFAELVTIRFVNSGYMSRDGLSGENLIVPFDHALFTSFEEMRCEKASPGFSATTATVTRDALARGYRALNGENSLFVPSFDRLVKSDTVGMIALRKTLSTLQDQMVVNSSQTDLMTPLLQEMLIYQMISAWPTIEDPNRTARYETNDRPVLIAMDYIEANLHRQIQIAELAAVTGIGLRTLQLGFKRRLGCSPVQYMIGRRLDHVHSALSKRSDRSIRAIAEQWGFTHMSDFSRRYRDRFGHTPRNRSSLDE